MPIYQPQAEVFCPHCEEKLEGVAEDFVIPGRTGQASVADEQCGHCDGEFSCVRLPDGTIEIEPIE